MPGLGSPGGNIRPGAARVQVPGHLRGNFLRPAGREAARPVYLLQETVTSAVQFGKLGAMYVCVYVCTVCVIARMDVYTHFQGISIDNSCMYIYLSVFR